MSFDMGDVTLVRSFAIALSVKTARENKHVCSLPRFMHPHVYKHGLTSYHRAFKPMLSLVW